jgi:indole-3-glycerol phosphate synthase
MMLEQILEDTRRRIAAARAACSQDRLEHIAAGQPQARDLAAALAGPGVQLIAEIKRRSPSRGALAPGLDPRALAGEYALGGAAALSVLTEPNHFAGSLADLAAAREGLRAAGRDLPLLRKDFMLDRYQVVEARVRGADAILLIVAALNPEGLRGLCAEARRWGLSVLVEVHNEAEVSRALDLGGALLGINARNLCDMTVDLATVARLRPLIPAGVRVVAESGIHGPDDVRRLRDLGVDAMLVGEHLVRAGAPRAAVRELVEAGQ